MRTFAFALYYTLLFVSLPQLTLLDWLGTYLDRFEDDE